MNTDKNWSTNLYYDIFNKEFESSNYKAEIIIKYILSTINKLERDIIISRYKDNKSYNSIGRDYSLSGSHVSKKCKNSLKELNHAKWQKFILILTEQLDLIKIDEEKLREKHKQDSDDVLKQNLKKVKPIIIEELGLSLRSYNCLKRANINTIDDLTKNNIVELEAIRNMGIKMICEIISICEKHGLSLNVNSDGK